MAALTPVAIARHAATAGWRGTDLPIAVAVALASSSGYAERAGGLWGLPGEPGGDGAGNAVKAYARWRAGGWGMFANFANTKYLLYMPLAVPAVAHPDVVAIIAAPVVEGFKDGLDSVLPAADLLDTARTGLSLAVKAGQWLGDRHNWARVAMVVIGATMITTAVAMVSRPDQTLGAAAGALVRPILKGLKK